MTITDVPHQAAPDTPVSVPPAPVSGAPGPVSWAPDSVSETDNRNPIKPGRDRLMLVLSAVAAIGGTLVGVIGFAMSYSTLAEVALSWGFSHRLAGWFPVGVDASIIAFLALDLYLIRKDTGWPLLRAAAHTMTAATIWFNASSQGDIGADPVRSASHGVMPLLFVIGVEAARKLFIKKVQLEAGTATDRIPLHRWILSPLGTPRIYRRMRLYGITSYPEMTRRERDLKGYEQWLLRQHNGSLDKASDDERLPMTMAPYGYTVAEALALPERQEREAQERAEEAARRRLEAQTRQEQAQARAEADRLRAEGMLEAVRAQVAAETGQARAQARAQVSAAERVAEREEAALETALLAEARAREAAAEREAAQQREAAAAADVRAAALEQQAADKRKLAAEADRIAAAEAQAVETQAIAEARKAAAEADRAAAETEQAAAETRRATAEANRQRAEEERLQEAAVADTARAQQDAAEAHQRAAEMRLAAAETERSAVEAEDAARLTPRERAVRKVARVALAAGLIPIGLSEHEVQRELSRLVSIADVQSACDVSSTDTASRYRTEAAALIASGYHVQQ
ncbi:DUF2637 domain-containing protein [Streptomyces sp. NPDC127038]|uniref:DUF2637 domain-containing protein n=1 Tax=Streptomyces sp. NPDC127038 TaxID=3347114 RepID=UPI00365AA8C3